MGRRQGAAAAGQVVGSEPGTYGCHRGQCAVGSPPPTAFIFQPTDRGTVRDMLAARLRRLAGAATSLALWLREGGKAVKAVMRSTWLASVAWRKWQKWITPRRPAVVSAVFSQLFLPDLDVSAFGARTEEAVFSWVFAWT